MDGVVPMDIQAHRTLRKHYEDVLHPVVDLSDLPQEVSALLDECVQLQKSTHLQDLQENYRQEFFHTKQKELIENNLTIGRLQAEVKEQENELSKQQAECEMLEKFNTEIQQCTDSETIMGKCRDLEIKLKALQERQASDTSPKDLNMDEIVRKVELLEGSKKKSKAK